MATETARMPEDNRDPDSGRYTAKFTTADVTDAINALGGSAGTQEIADELGRNYDTVYSRLRQLEDSGEIGSRKVANARLWSVADE